MRLEGTVYQSHAVVKVLTPEDRCVIADTGADIQNARDRIVGRLKRMVEFGRDAELLLAAVDGAEVEVVDAGSR